MPCFTMLSTSLSYTTWTTFSSSARLWKTPLAFFLSHLSCFFSTSLSLLTLKTTPPIAIYFPKVSIILFVLNQIKILVNIFKFQKDKQKKNPKGSKSSVISYETADIAEKRAKLALINRRVTTMLLTISFIYSAKYGHSATYG
jgi:hypothetical protein